ncbi:MAG: phosphoribosylanthranilate isomerase [Anaerolineaceae bacterium]|nr:phosphoribosylanthranilate isomerase [Anaerolineaceae bacterium]
MIIQIYSLTDIDDAVQCAEMGVDQIGFVAGKYGIAPAELDFAEAAALRKALPQQTVASAITMSADVEEILRMADAVKPDIVHISTDLDDVPPEKMLFLKQRLNPAIRITKAIAVGGNESIRDLLRYMEFSDIILLDTKFTHINGIGASGATHDWNISRKIVELSSKPVILAGGLHAGNVVEAINKVKPWGVDSFTCTSRTDDNSRKDLEEVRAFVRAIRENEANA